MDDQVTTAVQPVSDWLHAELDKVRVRHEQTLHFEGRYRNDPINEVIRVDRFDVYLPKQRGATTHAYVCGRGQIWRDAFRRMHGADGRFAYTVEELDLLKLISRLEAGVGGGWFGNLKIEKVKSAALFGADVTESDDWSRLERLGDLTTIYVVLDDESGEPQSLMLGRDWTIVVYRDRGEVANLDFVAAIRAEILRAQAEAT